MLAGRTTGYRQGTLLRDGRYRVNREVNRGGSAVVYLALDLHLDKEVALKVMDYTRDLQILYKSVKREVQFSAHTQHDNIVQLLDVFADKQSRTLVIVWEFIHGPDLLECLNRRGGALGESEAAFYFCQLLRGLLFMHQTGFAHRDVKPENCVLQESTGIVKLIDFGLTKHIESARTMLVGTPEYMAPELVRNPNAQFLQYSGGSRAGSSSVARQGYDAKKVDAWAMGILFYVLVAAQYPFSDPSKPGSVSSVNTQLALLSGRYRALPAHVTAGATDIVKRLLVTTPDMRAGLEEIARDQWLLHAAMSFAKPRGLSHLVQPPLAPAAVVHNSEAAAAAAAASNDRRQSRMPRTTTGGSGVSGVSAASGISTATVTTVSEDTEHYNNSHASPAVIPAAATAVTQTSSTGSTGTLRGMDEQQHYMGTADAAASSDASPTAVTPPPPPAARPLANRFSQDTDRSVDQQQRQRQQQVQQPKQRHAAAGGGANHKDPASAASLQSAAPQRVLYAAHTTYTPGSSGKVGLGEQQLFAVRQEMNTNAQQAAAAEADAAAAKKPGCLPRCCVIC